MRNNRLKLMVNSALFAALVCISTMMIQIPSPMNGYVNLGDCFVLISGYALGPVYGALAAGTGAMFADIFTGYGYYAPATLIIKSLMAMAAFWTFKGVSKPFKLTSYIKRSISGTIAELIMIFGYFLYASLLLGRGLAAAASIPGNAVQGIVAIVSSVLVMELITKNKTIEKYLLNII